MANYLDQNGLRYFWGKIKAKMPGPLQAYPVGSVYISISSNFRIHHSVAHGKDLDKDVH